MKIPKASHTGILLGRDSDSQTAHAHTGAVLGESSCNEPHDLSAVAYYLQLHLKHRCRTSLSKPQTHCAEGYSQREQAEHVYNDCDVAPLSEHRPCDRVQLSVHARGCSGLCTSPCG